MGILAALLFGAGGQSQRSAEHPVLPFEDHGACPFECCTYRTWTVEADTNILVERRDGAPLAFRVHRGETVQGLTGVVITTKLGVARVYKDTALGNDGRQKAKAGDTIYLLHYVGEGYWSYWFHGQIGEDDIPDEVGSCVDAKGKQVQCPVRITEKPETVWWVKVRSSAGKVGWTRQVDHFDNIDACG